MLLINVLLLAAGFAGAIVAFGGDTWAKGQQPLLERVTVRGWISILSLVIALGLGVCKEFLTKSQELLKDAQNKQREAQLKADSTKLQGQLDDAMSRLKRLQERSDVTEKQLTLANQALAQNRRVVAGVAKVEGAINGQVDTANQQILLANRNLEKSGQVLDAMSGLQTQIRDVTLLNALSHSQNDFDIEVRTPIRPIRLTEGPVPKTLVDLVFPRWRDDGPQDEDKLTLSFELESFNQRLKGMLWGFRKDPYKIMPLGFADADEVSAATGTSLKMYGDVRLEQEDGEYLLVSSFRFPESQVPGRWLSEFRKGTRLFTIEFILRDDLPAAEAQNLIRFWEDMFQKNALLRIPLIDQDNFFMEYELQRGDVVLKKEGLSTLSVTYSITSLPSFKTQNL